MYVLEMVGTYLGISNDILFESALDSEENIRLLESLFEVGGRLAIFVQYKLSPPPGLASGRYDSNKKEDSDMPVFSDARSQGYSGKAAVAYRTENTEEIDPIDVADVSPNFQFSNSSLV